MQCLSINKGENCRIFVGLNSPEIKGILTNLAATDSLPLYLATKIELKENNILLERNFYAGKLLNKIGLPYESMVIILDDEEYTIHSSDLPIELSKIEITADKTFPEDALKLIEVKEESTQELDITEAKIVVCVGRGIGSKENIGIAKKLAKKLGAAFGATRPLVDIEWVDQKHQIGQSGRSIKPDIYISFGVSGAIQHQVGINKSKYIIAVNSDPEAAIFEIADLGIVGDLFEIIPELIKKVK